MKTLLLAGLATLMLSPAQAQSGTVPQRSGMDDATVVREPNSTGNDRDLVISRGATGADTIETDSAAGGNAGRPEQAIPNSSASGR